MLDNKIGIEHIHIVSVEIEMSQDRILLVQEAPSLYIPFWTIQESTPIYINRPGLGGS